MTAAMDRGATMKTYVDLARQGAQEYRDEVLYTFLLDGESQETHLTWTQLDVRARAVAAQLQEHGLAGRCVLLIYPAGLDYVVAFFACLYAGVIAVPAYPPMLNRSVSQLRNIIPDASIEVALTNGEVHAKLAALTGIEPALAQLSWLVTDAVPDDRAEDWRPPPITEDSIAFLQYTSGSTSAPKGAMLTHGNLTHCGAVFAERIIEPRTRLLSWLPQYHDLGLFCGLLQPVYGRNSVILMSPMDFLRRPARWVQAISRYRVHATAAPNFAYDLCARKTTSEEVAALDLSCWQVAINAAEPVRAATLARFDAAFAGAGFAVSTPLNVYGLAEGLVVSMGPKDEPPQVTTFDANSLGRGLARPANGHGTGLEFVSAGRVVDGQHVLVVDATSKTKCDPGRVGEIWVAGYCVGRGYWNRPRETGETFGARLADGAGPFLRTGDLGFVHDGELYVTGRSKDVIIVRGQNVCPQDLERTAEDSHPALRPGCGAAVDISSGAENEGDRIVVVQEVRPDWRGALADSGAAVHRAITTDHGLTLYAVVLIAAGQIPKTSSGKIRRQETRRMLLAGEFDVLHEWRAAASNDEPEHGVFHAGQPLDVSRAPEEIEAWLVGLLSERFDTPPGDIDTRAPFAKLGLGSIQAVEMATHLANWLRFPVPSLIAWDHPTIEAVARHLATEAIRHTREPAA
jgi:acyl-CoA synthetase (AMP-forming)/AMP-acid ligase II/acyl carrier protein